MVKTGFYRGIQVVDWLHIPPSKPFYTQLTFSPSRKMGVFFPQPSVEMPLLGQVVIVTSLCILDFVCGKEVAAVLCQLLPLMTLMMVRMD